MILLGTFLNAVGYLLSMIINLFVFLFIARAVLSWVNPDPYNTIVQFINNATEPILSRVRSKVPPFGMLDLSVIIVIFGLYFINAFLVEALRLYAANILASATRTPIIGL